ncbi:MAG TPA: tetratricopeptide repeat protein [Pseudomonadales bacterium]
MHLKKLLPLASLALLLLQACAQVATMPAVEPPSFGDSSHFGQRPDLPTPDELHRLEPDQAQVFLTHFNHPSRAHVPPHVRLAQYVENRVGTYQYSAETHTAASVLRNNAGNCLSLAILTTALAELAGVEIRYQLMDDQPVYEYQGSVVIRGWHISALVANAEWKVAKGSLASLAMSPGIRIDYFPELRGRFLANLDRNGYLALYYDNIASDAIARGDYDTAYWNLQESLRHVPDHGASLNMLAVVNRRKGNEAIAESIYRYGIEHADDKLSLLKNYHTLLVVKGRHAEAAAIQQQLDQTEDSSPLHWLQLARASEANADWEGAIAYYRRVVQLAPYMHEVHLALARAYHASGELHHAESALIEAVTLANRVSTRNLYKAKLMSLRKEI